MRLTLDPDRDTILWEDFIMTSYWLIISETDSDGTETRLGEYGADSSMFDLNAVLAESEDVLRGLMNANIYYMDAPSGRLPF